MKRKTPMILLLLLAILLMGIGWFFFLYQSKPTIVDEMNQNTEYQDEIDGGGTEENRAVFNKNIHVYMGEAAQSVNNEIQKVEMETSTLKISFPKDTNCELATLGIGEIFFLEGNSNTPLEDTYIGRIVDVEIVDEQTVIHTETPMIDEVFDVFCVNEEFELSSENIRSISCAQGVKITPVKAISADFFETVSSDKEVQASNLLWNHSNAIEAVNTKDEKFPGLIFDIDLELDLDAIIKKKTPKDTQEGNVSAEQKNIFRVNGKYGMEDVKLYFNADWDKASYGMRELAAGISGKEVHSIEVELKAEGEVSGETTKKNITSFLHITGLKKKVFPIAYIDYTTSVPVKMYCLGLNNKIDTYTEVLPLSYGFMVYADFYGNLSLALNYKYNYSNDFVQKVVFVRDGQAVCQWEETKGKDPEISQILKLEASADADFHIGASAMAYCFNINLLEVAAIKLGCEVEGKGTAQWTWPSDSKENLGFSGSLYSRAYAKVGDVQAKLKIKADLWGVAEVDGGLEFEMLLIDKTLKEFGQKKDTHYNSESMGWGKMTAEDEKYFYYKSLHNELVRETKNGISRTTIYEDDFFQICGVDKSYLYVLEPTGDENVYNVRRISKDGTTSKKILDDVKYVLLMKDNLMYYVPDSSENTIYTLDRSRLKKKKFAKFDENVFALSELSDGFYVATEESDIFSFFLGATVVYYQISFDGKVIQRHDDITPEVYFKEELENYILATKLISNGYLRNTAEEVCWMANNQGSYVVAEGISGWNPTQEGIFTTQETEQGKYIVLYQATNGNKRTITAVNSDNAFFTLLQSDSGDWYFIDQTETDLLLYRMDGQFKTKTLLEQISLSKLPCDLESCGMEIRDNRLFFYNMTSWSESKMLYRYNLF